MFNYPVKFKDENGKISDVSLKVVSDNQGGFRTEKGNSQVHFPKNVKDGISISGNGVSVDLKPNGISSIAESTDKYNVSYIYDESTILDYSLTYTGIKEDIVVYKYTGQTEYEFTLNTNGLKPEKIDGSYFLINDNGEIKGTIGDIIILTADGKNNAMGYMTHYEVVPNEQYIITVHVDDEYLNDPKTKYPIRIDPTIEISYNTACDIDDATIYSDGAMDGTGNELYVGKKDGKEARILMRFYGRLSDIPSARHVNSASFYMTNLSTGNTAMDTENMTLMMYMYNGGSWNENSEYISNADFYSNTQYMSSKEINTVGTRYGFGITNAIKNWINLDFSLDQGIMITARDVAQYGSNMYKSFASFNATYGMPSLWVNYSETETYTSAPFGWFDKVDSNGASGWVWCFDEPDEALDVKLYFTNTNTNTYYPPVTVSANIHRADVEDKGYGDGDYGFYYPIVWSSYPAGYYRVMVYAVMPDGSGTEHLITLSPKFYNNSGVVINPTQLSLEVGQTHTFVPYINGQAVTQSAITWVSDNSSVVGVNNGTVTAYKAGTATVTAIWDGSWSKCVVTVKKVKFNIGELELRADTPYWMRIGNNYLNVTDGKWKEGSAVGLNQHSYNISRNEEGKYQYGKDISNIQHEHYYWKIVYKNSSSGYQLVPWISQDTALGNTDENNGGAELCLNSDLDETGYWLIPDGDGNVIIRNANTLEYLYLASGNIYEGIESAASKWEFIPATCYNTMDGSPRYDDVTHHALSLEPITGKYKCQIDECYIEFMAPEMQDYDIMTSYGYLSDYIAILALQKSYVENVMEKDWAKAEATMRVIDYIRSSNYNGLYDFRDSDGDYVSNYKYAYDSYDFYVDVSVSDNTQLMQTLTNMSMINDALEMATTFIKMKVPLEAFLYASNKLISAVVSGNSISNVIYDVAEDANDEINNKMDAKVLNFIKDGCGDFYSAVKDVLGILEPAWSICSTLAESFETKQYNYTVTIEYVNENGSEDNKGKRFFGDYRFNASTHIEVYDEGFCPLTQGYAGCFGEMRYTADTHDYSGYGYWVDIVGQN